jgi:hypothetical protein
MHPLEWPHAAYLGYGVEEDHPACTNSASTASTAKAISLNHRTKSSVSVNL